VKDEIPEAIGKGFHQAGPHLAISPYPTILRAPEVPPCILECLHGVLNCSHFLANHRSTSVTMNPRRRQQAPQLGYVYGAGHGSHPAANISASTWHRKHGLVGCALAQPPW